MKWMRSGWRGFGGRVKSKAYEEIIFNNPAYLTFGFCVRGYCADLQPLKDILAKKGYCLDKVTMDGNRMDCAKDEITIIFKPKGITSMYGNEITVYGIADKNITDNLCKQFEKNERDKGARSSNCTVYNLPISESPQKGSGMIFTTGGGL